MGDYVDMTRRLAKALTRHAPHGYDPASDDMTVEFAVKLSEQDAEIASLRGSVAHLHTEHWKLKNENDALRAELEASRKDAAFQCERAADKDCVIESLRAELASVRLTLDQVSVEGAADRAAARQDAKERDWWQLAMVNLVEWWGSLPASLRQDIEGSGAEPGAIAHIRNVLATRCSSEKHARQDADTIEALRRTLDSVRSDRDASDAEIRRLKARSAEEMARLTGAIGRAVLAVTVSGLTVEGYKNACAQARDLLRAALACAPTGMPSGVQQAEEIAGARQALAACCATIEKDAEEILRLKEALGPFALCADWMDRMSAQHRRIEICATGEFRATLGLVAQHFYNARAALACRPQEKSHGA